jgi:hypothetical protein
MQFLVTGSDSEGKSCIVSKLTFGPDTDPGIHLVFDNQHRFWQAVPDRKGRSIDLGVGKESARSYVVRWMPGEHIALHHTDTLDFDTVIAGEIDLVLQDGIHRLEASDSVVLVGVDHAWTAGPNGCTMAFFIVELPSANQRSGDLSYI